MSQRAHPPRPRSTKRQPTPPRRRSRSRPCPIQRRRPCRRPRHRLHRLPSPPPTLPAGKLSATELFGAASEPAALPTQAIGGYSKGCLAGAKPLPVTSSAWQVMRVSRNRNWGHPALVQYIERFAIEAKTQDGWPGLLVGDMSQPRGGPLASGHASHQIGLDVDIWYASMPDRQLSRKERDQIPLTSVLDERGKIDPRLWTPALAQLLRRAASYPVVERIFVNPAIKMFMCETAGADRAFLRKLRPFWGHDDHFHVRIGCPPGSTACQHQSPVAADDGCGKEVEQWLRRTAPTPPPAQANAALPANAVATNAVQAGPAPAAAPLTPAAGAAPTAPAVQVAAGAPASAQVTPALPAAIVTPPPMQHKRVAMDKLPTQCRAVVAAAAGPSLVSDLGH